MIESVNAPAAAPAMVSARHPRGLYTLFFTEMWERFSYYGMRALLVLFMVDAVQKGGMGMTDKTANAIYGLYTAAVYLMSLPGGWFADRLWGAQRAVWYGGIIIALGHFTLAIPRRETFFLGLIFVAIGSGILKPNMSALVGELYPEGGSRRDAGFTIFYMGVNLGAFIGPLICSTLGEKINWHYGFGAAGVGMVLGLIQFKFSRHLLGAAGLQRGNDQPLHAFERFGLFGGSALAVMVVSLGMAGLIQFDPVAIARVMTYVIVAIGVLYFLYVFLIFGLNKIEKERVGVIVVLFLASALFWAGFEQAGSSFNLFAKRYTVRTPGFDFTTFGAADVTNLPVLAGKLVDSTDDVSRFVFEQFSTNVQATLAGYVRDGGADPNAARQALLRGLNRVVNGDPIYEPERFAAVTLSAPTRELADQQAALSREGKKLKEDQLVRLNRWLLEDAYSPALTQSHSQPVRFVVPAGWFQALGPIFIILFAPLFAALWVKLARRHLDPSVPVKFAFGLLLLAAGFLVMAGAAGVVAAGNKAMPVWLIMTYVIHTFGELCLSPVGLSSVTKLAPRRLVGQMMGTWFLATSLGNLIAGLLAGEFNDDTLSNWPSMYLRITIMPTIAAVLLIVLSRPIKRWMEGVK